MQAELLDGDPLAAATDSRVFELVLVDDDKRLKAGLGKHTHATGFARKSAHRCYGSLVDFGFAAQLCRPPQHESDSRAMQARSGANPHAAAHALDRARVMDDVIRI